MDHHADAVADKNDIAMRIKQFSRGRVISRQTNERRSILCGGDVAHSLAAFLGLSGHFVSCCLTNGVAGCDACCK